MNYNYAAGFTTSSQRTIHRDIIGSRTFEQSINVGTSRDEEEDEQPTQIISIPETPKEEEDNEEDEDKDEEYELYEINHHLFRGYTSTTVGPHVLEAASEDEEPAQAVSIPEATVATLAKVETLYESDEDFSAFDVKPKGTAPWLTKCLTPRPNTRWSRGKPFKTSIFSPAKSTPVTKKRGSTKKRQPIKDTTKNVVTPVEKNSMPSKKRQSVKGTSVTKKRGVASIVEHFDSDKEPPKNTYLQTTLSKFVIPPNTPVKKQRRNKSKSTNIFDPNITGYGVKWRDAMPGDLVMAFASDINHPAVAEGIIHPSYILVGRVRYFVDVATQQRLKVFWGDIDGWDGESCAVPEYPQNKQVRVIALSSDCGDMDKLNHQFKEMIDEQWKYVDNRGWKFKKFFRSAD